MMEAIMERDENGKVTIGNQSCYIPENRTALSMMATNKIVDRAIYSMDGWVRVDGRRVKKWFTNIYAEGGGSPVKIWHPILEDVRALEARWWRMVYRRRKFGSEIWRPAYNAVMKAGEAHAKIIHKHSGELHWWHYKKVGEGDMSGISFDWVKDVENPINLEIGQHYYDMDHKMAQYGTYTQKFNVALARAIYTSLLAKEPPDNPGSLWRIVINGREFLYLSKQAGASQPFWQSVGWPDNNNATKTTILE